MCEVWIITKFQPKKEMIASCTFNDDAELIYNEYLKNNYQCWVVYSGFAGQEIMFGSEHELIKEQGA